MTLEVLLVEDNAMLRELTEGMVRELGHELVAVPDAAAGLRHLEQRQCHAVITDVSLPGMSGIEFAVEVARRWPHLPIIVCSGYEEYTTESLSRKLPGGIVTLSKPYRMAALAQVLLDVDKTRR